MREGRREENVSGGGWKWNSRRDVKWLLEKGGESCQLISVI